MSLDIENRLCERIMKSRDIKENSCFTYMRSLKTIYKHFTQNSEVYPTSTRFLHDFDTVMKIIDSEKKLTTKKNRLTSVLVALGSENPPPEKLIGKYSMELADLNDKYTQFLQKQTKTETQKRNWLDYEDIVEICDDLYEEVKARKLDGRQHKDDISDNDYKLLQRYVILKTYLTFPIRNNFSNMPVVSESKYKKIPKSKKQNTNYLVIKRDGSKEFHINTFKNKKHIGSQVLKVDKRLDSVINNWLKYNDSGFYLTNIDGTTPLSSRGITRFLNSLFNEYANGKKISTSMLRHIIISHALRNEKTLAEKKRENEKIEKIFFHSKGMNELYRKIN